jgi:hypothetical protein
VIDLPAGTMKRVTHSSGGSSSGSGGGGTNVKANRKSPIGWKSLFSGGRGRAKSQRRTTSDLKSELVRK